LVNLHYNYFRDYDPQTGRYAKSDPIGLQGGLNTYAYVKSNPLRYVDSLGLDAEMCTRLFYPVVLPYMRHCFVRFNGNDDDTSSFDMQAHRAPVKRAPNPPAPRSSRSDHARRSLRIRHCFCFSSMQQHFVQAGEDPMSLEQLALLVDGLFQLLLALD
jgi:hypothetical protein